MKRLFIESDVLQHDELQTAQRTISKILKKQNKDYSKDFFDEIKDFAWHKAEEAWQAVLRCDEIYAQTSLVPLCGFGSYTGAPVVFNTMMERAIKEDVRGKSVYLLRPYNDIETDQIDYTIVKQAFKYNDLYTLEFIETENDCYYEFLRVNITTFYKQIKNSQ